MIKITRLNDTVLVVNADMIEFLEATPDTIVTLTDGRKLIAKESVDEVVEKVVEYKKRFLSTGPEVLTRGE
jgi:flagellar protein FlbD